MAQFLYPISDVTNTFASGGFADIDETSPSDTDYAGIPEAWMDRSLAVESALVLLRQYDKLWQAVITQLMQHESITDGELRALARESV